MSRTNGAATADMGSEAAESIAPEGNVLALVDPLSFGGAMVRTAVGALKNPQRLAGAFSRYAVDMTRATLSTTARAFGAESEPAIEPGRKDRRFADVAWRDNPFLSMLLQSYLLWGRLAHEVVDVAAPELDPATAEKAGFLTEVVVDALAPSNVAFLNPAVRKKWLDTGGLSALRGLRTFMDDLATNGGLPRQVDPHAFTVGEDLACTPGKVVFRNDLMELIQYAPQTEQVHRIPLLLSPPWINKYYIMDLAPGRSFAEWAVQHGHTVFAISYRNPDERHRDVRLDDYLLSGPLAAIDVVQDITGAEQVNIVGLCLGGTLTTALLAYMASRGDDRVRSATLLNTLVDFSQPGRLGAFTDVGTVEHLERRMAKRGYMESTDMAGVFTFMRGNDLVWNYVVNNWLLGEKPPAFDILSWNADGTRMPAKMHSFYIRSCYIGNELARGQMELAGTVIDPTAIGEDVYVLAAREDHIVPWDGSYKTTQVLRSANVRFVQSASGHIAGIVNPPSPKAWYRTNGETPADSREWLEGSVEHRGSWWEDWTEWIAQRAGEMVDPPALGSDANPPQGDAPGEYVLGK